MSDLVSVPCPLSDPAHNWSHLRISSEYCIAGTVYCVVDLYIVHACVEMSVPGGTGKVQEVTAEVTELAQMVCQHKQCMYISHTRTSDQWHSVR